MRQRVVVTGLGAISSLGRGAMLQFEKARDAKSGITAFANNFPISVNTMIAGQSPTELNSDLNRTEIGMFDRVAQLSWVAASEALVQSGISDLSTSDLEQSGIFWGTGFGGSSTLERGYVDLLVEHKDRIRPLSIIGIMANGSAALISLKTKFQGPTLTYSTACASSAHAIGEAYRQISAGYCERAIAGGGESLLSLGSIKAWEALQTLAKIDVHNPAASCKPFSADRSGFVLGEGAAALVLESLSGARARGAEILAEIVGYGTSTDSVHMTKPDPAGQARAIRNAIQDARISPIEIVYINAHGTATPAGDIAETASIKLAFGDQAHALNISSTKAVHGHMLGAAGAIELLITICAQRNNIVPPTAFLEAKDPQCDLDYIPMQAREMQVPLALSNSFAFGGSNAVLITRKWQD